MATQFFEVTHAGVVAPGRESVRWNFISRFLFPHAAAYLEYDSVIGLGGDKLGIWSLIFRQEFPLIAIDYRATWYVANPHDAKLETIYATFVEAYDYYNNIYVDPVPISWAPASWAEANP